MLYLSENQSLQYFIFVQTLKTARRIGTFILVTLTTWKTMRMRTVTSWTVTARNPAKLWHRSLCPLCPSPALQRETAALTFLPLPASLHSPAKWKVLWHSFLTWTLQAPNSNHNSFQLYIRPPLVRFPCLISKYWIRSQGFGPWPEPLLLEWPSTDRNYKLNASYKLLGCQWWGALGTVQVPRVSKTQQTWGTLRACLKKQHRGWIRCTVQRTTEAYNSTVPHIRLWQTPTSTPRWKVENLRCTEFISVLKEIFEWF